MPEHITFEELQSEMDAALRFPGIPNIWTMPIRNRIDMLSTGVRTPIGIKILGPDLTVIQRIGEQLEGILRDVPGTRSVLAERTAGGYYLDFVLRRDALARYGLSVDDAQTIVISAIGGENVTTTVEGRERYTVNVRYARDFRDDLPALRRVLVPTPSGAQIPLAQLADIRMLEGPAMIRDENGQLAGYVYVDMTGRDVGGYVEEAKQRVAERARPADGLHAALERPVREHGPRARAAEGRDPAHDLPDRAAALPEHQVGVKTGIVLLAVPFSLVGAVWLLWVLGYNISIAVWVGMIALMGLDAETGVFMLLFLDLVYDERVRAGPDAHRGGPRGGDRPRRGEAHPAEDDDGDGGVHGPAADHVVDRHRRRRDEAHRRADGGRAGDVVRRSSCSSTRCSTRSGSGGSSCAAAAPPRTPACRPDDAPPGAPPRRLAASGGVG